MKFTGVGFIFCLLLIISLIALFRTDGESVARLRSVSRAAVSPVAAPLSVSANSVRAIFTSRRALYDGPARSDQTLELENARLRTEIDSLAGQLEELRRLNNERSRLGPLRDRSTPARVSGVLPGEQRLLLDGDAFEPGMAVVHVLGLVGFTDASRGVRLITGPEFRALVNFSRWTEGRGVTPQVEPAIVTGDGQGRLRIERYRLSQVGDTGLQLRDYVLINDPEFPPYLQGIRLGRVVDVKPLPLSPGFGTVIIEPTVDLTQLQQVDVVQK